MNFSEILKEYINELILNQNKTNNKDFQNLITYEDYEKILTPVLELVKNNPEASFDALKQELYYASNIRELISEFIYQKQLTPGIVLEFGTNHTHQSIVSGLKQEYTILNNNKVFYPLEMEYNSIFDLASTSKIFTAISILKLKEENRINLLTPVKEIIPEFTDLEDTTILDLLKFNKHIKTKVRIDSAKTKEEAEKILFSAYLYPEQEQNNAYTDIGAIILKYVVEKVTHMPFTSYVYETILKPLKMHDTHLIIPEDKIERVANENFSMKIDKNGLVKTTIDNVPGKVHDPKALALGINYGIAPGHAGYFSTVSDMYTLGKSLMNYEILNKESVLSISENLVGKKIKNLDSTYYYGSLVFVKQLDPNRLGVYYKMSGKTFMSPGFAGTTLYVDPLNKISLFMASNRLHNRIYDIYPDYRENIVTNYETGKQTYMLPNGTIETVSLNFTGKKEIIVKKALDLCIEFKFLEKIMSQEKTLTLKK